MLDTSCSAPCFEPAAFTKVSPLGVEEQRVKVILDPIFKDDAWSRLGHEYRVFVRITAWQADSVMQAPLSALFRRGSEWAVFRVENGRARLAEAGVGQRNAEVAEIIAGLNPAQRLIVHSSDGIANDARCTGSLSIDQVGEQYAEAGGDSCQRHPDGDRENPCR